MRMNLFLVHTYGVHTHRHVLVCAGQHKHNAYANHCLAVGLPRDRMYATYNCARDTQHYFVAIFIHIFIYINFYLRLRSIAKQNSRWLGKQIIMCFNIRCICETLWGGGEEQ